MLRWYYKMRIGTIYVPISKRVIARVNIFGGNCLCVFTQWYTDEKTGKQMESLMSFYIDENHLKRYVKNGNKALPVNSCSSIHLNTYYKESFTLAKYFTKEGHKVTMYYKEPKESKNG